MRIDKKNGAIRLSRTDTKRWHTSAAFREELLLMLGELIRDTTRKDEERSLSRDFPPDYPLLHRMRSVFLYANDITRAPLAMITCVWDEQKKKAPPPKG